LISGRPVIRIAHAYGNRRDTLREALAAAVDMIEADIWYQRGKIVVRHERRLGWLPVLADRRPRGVRRIGPWALPLPGRRYLRLDVNPISPGELLETAASKRLLLDVKAHDPRPAERFAAEIAREIERFGATDRVAVCGQFWPVLDRLREVAPEVEVRYSMERPEQWQRYVEMAKDDAGARGVCIQHRLLDEERRSLLAGSGASVYCWTVDDEDVARTLVEQGVDGIISNDLQLLGELPTSGR
jgi:glycerophosphoryl diester phosphodiesterase